MEFKSGFAVAVVFAFSGINRIIMEFKYCSLSLL